MLSLAPVLESFYIDDIQAFHLYFYTEKIQEILYQFKGCNDYELKDVFLEYYSRYLNLTFKGFTIVPAPSFRKGDEKRGYNHVEEMFKILKLKMLKCIHKTKEVKQADLTTKKRQEISKHLVIDNINLKGKKILIVDDVYTTGSTIRAMINLIKGKGAKNIRVLVMSKTIDLEKR